MEPERAQAIECETRSQELGWDLEEGGISEAPIIGRPCVCTPSLQESLTGMYLFALWFSIFKTGNLVVFGAKVP